MSKECPSSFALDAFRLGLDSTPADHVKGCPRCGARLAAQEQLEARVEHLWVAAPPKPRRPARVHWKLHWKYLLRLGLPVAAGAAALIFLALPRHADETAKGPAALVEIARSRGGVLSWLSPTDDLGPKDAVRFFVRRQDPSDRYVLIGSVDGSARLGPLYPGDAHGCSVALPAAGEPLDGSIVIDDVPGPERIVILISHRPLCWPGAGESLRRFALGDPRPAELLSEDRHVTRLVVAKRTEAGR